MSNHAGLLKRRLDLSGGMGADRVEDDDGDINGELGGNGGGGEAGSDSEVGARKGKGKGPKKRKGGIHTWEFCQCNLSLLLWDDLKRLMGGGEGATTDTILADAGGLATTSISGEVGTTLTGGKSSSDASTTCRHWSKREQARQDADQEKDDVQRDKVAGHHEWKRSKRSRRAIASFCTSGGPTDERGRRYQENGRNQEHDCGSRRWYSPIGACGLRRLRFVLATKRARRRARRCLGMARRRVARTTMGREDEPTICLTSGRELSHCFRSNSLSRTIQDVNVRTSRSSYLCPNGPYIWVPSSASYAVCE